MLHRDAQLVEGRPWVRIAARGVTHREESVVDEDRHQRGPTAKKILKAYDETKTILVSWTAQLELPEEAEKDHGEKEYLSKGNGPEDVSTLHFNDADSHPNDRQRIGPKYLYVKT